jgi:FkbM family methyltransferase
MNPLLARIRGAIRSLGYDIVRVTDPPKGPAWFYQTSPSCQIPTLGFLYEFFFGQTREGTFVDVGAYDGWGYSNTSCLGDAGWTGLCVEPVPAFADRCRGRHAANQRVTVVTAAAGAAHGETVITVAGPSSSLHADVTAEFRKLGWDRQEVAAVTPVSVVPLDQLLEEHGIAPEFDVLSVDVEGHECDVFAGFDLRRWRPRLMIVEMMDAHSEVLATREQHAHLARRILQDGYTIVYKDALNTIFVSDALWAHTYPQTNSHK